MAKNGPARAICSVRPRGRTRCAGIAQREMSRSRHSGRNARSRSRHSGPERETAGSRPASYSAALELVEDGAEPIAFAGQRRRVEPAEGDGRKQDAVDLAERAERDAVE